ncbi:unnamed protein product [Bursaphelenchus okinawaensis]|uniref:Uncharacterized protein n=1 Tax=Bursaphelenchus okinawaensis TaxID=465554 RepID=A0A811LS43_9BILA|nr:unnamed protein product [Bursaphelenchus okinawaensis]CAG9127781.1 unnamed protein product [Bursaphelenchus okinawaensis]
MGCKLSSQAARMSAGSQRDSNPIQKVDTGGTQQHQIGSVQQDEVLHNDYLDGVDISRVDRINIYIYGNSTVLTIKGFTNDFNAWNRIIEFCGRYHVIEEKLTQCLKSERSFVLRITLFSRCVWSPALLNELADFFLDWLPLKYTQVDDFQFVDSAMLEVLCQQDIVMPQVCSVTFCNYQCETVNIKLFLEKACSVFLSIKHLQLKLVVHVQEKNEPIRNHELFTYTRTVIDTFESILDWNQGKLNIFIYSQVDYNGLVNEDLARKMSEYIGYEWSYDGDVGLDVSMFNVDLMMFVQYE